MRASQAHRACEAREKKPSLPSLALCFQPCSRPFVWLLTHTWICKNTDCFAVYQGKNEKSHLLSGKGQSVMSSNNKLYFMTTNDFSDAASYFNLFSLIWRRTVWYKPEGNSFVFQRVLMFSSTLSRKHQDLRENKTNWFPEGPDIKCFVIFLAFHFNSNKRTTRANQNSRLGTYNNQHAKKVVSDSPGLVDFAIRLVIFVLNLPDGQVLFFGEIQITEGL